MTRKTHDLAVKTGEYTNSKGEKKGRYVNIGVMMESDDGKPFILMDTHFNPAGVPSKNGRFAVSLFEPKEMKPEKQDQSNDVDSDYVPF